MTSWIEHQPALHAMLAEAQRAEPALDPDSLITALRNGGGGLGRSFRWASQTEEGRAVLIWRLMKQIAAEDLEGTEGTRRLGFLMSQLATRRRSALTPAAGERLPRMTLST